MPGVIGGLDGRTRIAGLALDEAARVMTEREIRAQHQRFLDLHQRLVQLTAQPQRAAQRPVRRRIAIVGDEALARRLEARAISVWRAAVRCRNAFWKCVKDRQACARANVRSCLSAIWKKCAARALSSPLKRYMCQRPR